MPAVGVCPVRWLEALADDLPEAQRSLLLALSSFLTPAAMSALKEQLAAPRSDAGAQFESLPPPGRAR